LIYSPEEHLASSSARIPLEGPDLVIDPVGRKLIGNPEHGGERMFEIL
jgi:hypothetical protein